nr:hypothetical protein pmam_330 [Pithovirus mammoth]
MNFWWNLGQIILSFQSDLGEKIAIWLGNFNRI